MSIPVTCLRCGLDFSPTDRDLTIAEDEESVISAKCPHCGKVEDVFIKAGDSVNPGDVIMIVK